MPDNEESQSYSDDIAVMRYCESVVRELCDHVKETWPNVNPRHAFLGMMAAITLEACMHSPSLDAVKRMVEDAYTLAIESYKESQEEKGEDNE